MDKTVVIQYTNSLEDLEKQKDEYNKLTYREKKFSDMKQEEISGMYNSDMYELIKSNILLKDKTDISINDKSLNEKVDLDLENIYNKSKYNNNHIDKEIRKCTKKLEKNKDDKNTKNRLEYLKCIKDINKNDTTTLDRIYILEVNAICKLNLDKKEKIKYINIIISDIKKIIMNYDIAISYMYKENKIEDGIKKAGELVCTNILGNIIGPAFNIISFAIKRNNTRLMVNLKSSVKPKDDLVKEKDKLENTLKVIELKKKQLEE